MRVGHRAAAILVALLAIWSFPPVSSNAAGAARKLSSEAPGAAGDSLSGLPLSSLPPEAQENISRAVENDLSFSQLAKLTATDKISEQEMGYSIGISGNTVVVGAPAAHPHDQQSTPGAAYVFVKPASGWRNMTQVAKLTASEGGVGDYFGYSIGISGNTIVVGAPNHVIKSWKGAVYVFVQPAGGWTNMTQTAELTASNATQAAQLGSSVGITGDTIVATAPSQDVGSTYLAGAAYVFVEPASGWANMTETAELTASDPAYAAYLGNAVAIAGDTIAVADREYNYFGGAIYVFVKPSGGWTSMEQTAKLTPADESEGREFGDWVATNGNTVVATDPGYYPNPPFVDVFVEPQGGWADMTVETAQLSVSNGTVDDGLATSLAMSGNLVVAGAEGTPPAAYVFVEPQGSWKNMTQTAMMQAAGGQAIGSSVALSGTTVVSGAAGAQGVGAAYVFGSQ
jgi:FG-GAP repeat